MEPGKDKRLWRYRWHIAGGGGALVVVVLLLVIFGRGPEEAERGTVPQVIWLIGGLALLAAVLAIVLRTFKILDVLEDCGASLERMAEVMEKSAEALAQISQNTRLSETAKTIASREADRQSLREAVLEKLHQQEFDSTYEIIDEISHSSIYTELAEQLRAEADKYRDATDQERINQVIAHIERLFEDYQWPKASALTERLIKAYPNSEKAKSMRQRLLDKKEERKKELLNAWDDAVKNELTDRSLEILKELDLYLTPNEGLALQEAARDVFRNKLHSLGVQFSLAVTGKQWDKAVEVGEQIINDFPNSKMAEEIREKWDILKQRVAQEAS